MNILDMLSGALSGNSQQTQQVAQNIGATPEQTSSAMQAAVPMVLQALHQNTQQGGEQALGQALQNHDGSTLDSFQQGQLPDTDEGQRVVQHAFGNNADSAAQQLAQHSGLDVSAAGTILATIAPLVLSALGRSQNQGGMSGAGGLSGMLGGLLSSFGGSGGLGGMGGMLGSVLGGAGGQSSGGQNSGGLGGMLGGMLGGQGQSEQTSRNEQSTRNQQQDRQEEQDSGGQSSGGLGGMLGSVLGGLENGGQNSGGQNSGRLGGLLGGGQHAHEPQNDTSRVRDDHHADAGATGSDTSEDRQGGGQDSGSLSDLAGSAEQDVSNER